ncbi:hypothetical protein ACSHWG_05265 [Leucobacter sp. Z1108]|uniref:hypothetical protein n=1 Tax=Leucobacter sp. Z1108 TaxID=3439066 RepID=UPI003F3690C2
MSFSVPKFGVGLVLSALVVTQVLTGAAAVPTQAELLQPAGSAATSQTLEADAGERIPELLAELTDATQAATQAIEANAVSSPAIDEAGTALSQHIRAAEHLSPSAWLTANDTGAHLVEGNAELLAELERDLNELRGSLSAWEGAIEAHLAEEDARQAEAARVLATAAAVSAAPQRPAVASPPAQVSPTQSGYTVSPAGSGGQALIDACVGPVWWTPSWFPYLAEHWHCGGAAFPKQAGAIVTIAGSGVYQSAGIVKQVNAYVEDMNAVPSGYDVYYQTCLNNDPSTSVIIGLVRIG